MRDEGLSPYRWVSGAGVQYGWHEHGYYKVLYCVSGSIVFHTHSEGDVAMAPGDRLDLDAGTAHAATVGATGVVCVEAPRRQASP